MMQLKKKKMPYKNKQCDAAKKSSTLSAWKKNGLLETREFMEQIYNEYLNSKECQLCGEPYSKKNKKSMDHCHNTGKFRNIVCNRCNCWKSDKAVKYIYYVNSEKTFVIRITREGKRIINTKRKTQEECLKLLEETKIKYPHYFT